MGKSGLLGGPSILLLLLFLLPGDATTPVEEKPQYLVLVPVLIHTETPENICFQMNNLNETVTLSITMEYEAQNRSLIRNVVSEEDVFRCVSIQLPKMNGSSDTSIAFFTVEVKGETLSYWNRKRVLVQNMDTMVFAQTDKSIYKPGQPIQFRIVSVDEHFRPVNEKFPLVYIEDPKRNRIAQWQDVTLHVGLIQLSIHLSSEPIYGTYKVVIKKASGKTIERSFEAKEYVLPKFEVTVKAPKQISIMTEQVEVTTCAKYTYSKSVPGDVKMSICRPYSSYRSRCYGRESEAVCEDFIGKADANGCFSKVVKTKVFQLKRDEYRMNLEVEATFKEEGTGVEQMGTATIDITQVISITTFENTAGDYKLGIPYTGQVKMVDGNEKPITNETVEIQIHAIGYKAYYTTNDQGIAEFSIDTSNFTGSSIYIQAVYKTETPCYDRYWSTPRHRSASQRVVPFFSLNGNYLHIMSIPGTLSCGHRQSIHIHYILNPDIVKGKKVVFHYLVSAKGGIVSGGTHVLAENHEDKGEFLLDLLVNEEIAPLMRMLVYTILPNGELMVDSIEYDIEQCFLNKVKLQFSEDDVLPGSETHLHVEASKGSLCAIHAVDQSVLILKPEAELSPKTVYDLLPVKELKGYYYQQWNLQDPDEITCVPPKNIVIDGIRYIPEMTTTDDLDASKIVENFGLKILTNTMMHKPVSCREMGTSHYNLLDSSAEGSFTMAAPLSARGKARMPGAARTASYRTESDDSAQPLKINRNLFPETWIWQMAVVNKDQETEGPSPPHNGVPQGEIDIPLTVPDTITEWKTGAFCLSTNTGFGLAKTIPMHVYMPFFIDFTMPYSVVRGEEFLIKVTAFTYLRRCIQVKVSLESSEDFEAVPVEEEKEFYCLCANERKTKSWLVTPKSLGSLNFTASAESVTSEELCGNEIVEQVTVGRKDTVTKALIVEPEGIEKEVAINNLLCSGGKVGAQAASVSLKLPEAVVEGSARAYTCVLSDILSNTIQNLHQLLKLPYGCGEQNVALLAPNIYILDYLNATGQLTEAIKSKATGYLVTGYQRQLNYKHSDGSYSTFGERGQEPGNSWLTAFVLKCLAQAKKHIFVEERHITDAQAWLAVRQKENGCFRSVGTLLNNALKGGVNDEVTHSAYITIALLEIPLTTTHSVVRNALFCLETAQAKETHVYTQALLAYAFALAGKNELRNETLRRLDEVAVKEEDGSIHWDRPEKEEETSDFAFYGRSASSADVETAAYILLAYLSLPPKPSHEDLTKATSIVQWLTKQQNPNGGFSSTQDTVVAVQALAEYGRHTFSKGGADSQVTLSSEGNALKQFQVDEAHRLLYQCHLLPKVPGDYKMEVSGEGCVHTQTILRFNVHPQRDNASFALTVHADPETCTGPKAHQSFAISINASYVGKNSVSNMAIINVKIPSGFVPVKSSVKKLQELHKVSRVEMNTGHVLLYFEKLTNDTRTVSFIMEMDVPVQGLKLAPVTIYDYYNKDEFAETGYTFPCKIQ